MTRLAEVSQLLVLFIGVLFAFFFISLSSAEQLTSPPSKALLCSDDKDGKHYIRDESIQVQKGTSQNADNKTTTKSECVPEKSVKDSKDRVCEKGRFTYYTPEGKSVSVCSENAQEQLCKGENGCSEKILADFEKREVPVTLSERTKDLQRQLFRVSEYGENAQTAALRAQLIESQRADISQALLQAFPDTEPAKRAIQINNEGGENVNYINEEVRRVFSGLSSNCSSGDVCVREVLRGPLDNPYTYIVPPEGAPIAALAPDLTTKEIRDAINYSTADKAWYGAVRDTFLNPQHPKWYDKDTGLPGYVDRPVFDALQQHGTQLYHVPELVDQIWNTTNGKITPLLDSLKFSYTSLNPGTYDNLGIPIEASRLADSLVQVWGEIRTMPQEIWDNPLTSPTNLRIFSSTQNNVAGNALIALFEPSSGVYPGAFSHEFAHRMMYHVGGITDEQYAETARSLSQYIYNTPLEFRQPFPLQESDTQPSLTNAPLTAYAQENLSERMAEAMRLYLQDPVRFATVAQRNPDSEMARIHNALDAALYAQGVHTPLWAREYTPTWAEVISPLSVLSPLYARTVSTPLPDPGDAWRSNMGFLASRLYSRSASCSGYRLFTGAC